MCNASGIPCSPTPEFLAVLQTMPGDAISATHQQFRPSIVLERNRRAIGFMGFQVGFRRTRMFPQALARLWLNREQVGVDRALAAASTMHRFVSLQHL